MKHLAPICLLAALAVACGGSGSDPCIGEPFANQPSKRFPTGSTYLLPTVAPSCSGAAWAIRSSPSGNLNEIVVGSDGYVRFTPHVPGEHVFELTGTDETWSVGVIGHQEVPFHNLNYYPSRSMVVVGDELWVANVSSPTVTPMSTATLLPATPVAVGSWPVAVAWTSGMDHVVVAQRAADSIGLVDVATRRNVDSIHVGDEPANVVVSPDGALAYVALQTEGRVAVVDLAAREVVARIEVGRDLLAMAISPNGESLFVASHRSGHPDRFPYDADPLDEERDIMVIDTTTRTVRDVYMDVGTTIKGLEVSADGKTLYATLVHNDTQASFLDPEQPNFLQELAVYDVATSTRRALINVSRQPSSGGPVAFMHGMAETATTLWVVAEGVDELVGLSREDFREVHRVAAPGRPRFVVADAAGLFVHGAQSFVVTAYSDGGDKRSDAVTAPDPRPADIAEGQAYFTGAGLGYGADWSCNGCHADGLSDTIAWRVGPTPLYEVTRPLFWLEGTKRLGWPGYAASARNFAFEGGSTIGRQATSEQAVALGRYLESIMPPHAANAFTNRDGSHSEQGARGKELFNGKAGCVGCHPLPLGTNRKLFEDGITPGPSDTPTLIGAYRHNVWLQAGQARTLRDAVKAAADWIEVDLTDAELDDVTRFVSELTARDFFAIGSTPAHKATKAAVDQPIVLSMSAAVFSGADGVGGVRLVDGAGAEVPASITASGRHITVTPADALAFASDYRVEIDAGLEAFDERLALEQTIRFSTAAAPAVRLDGEYTWTIHMPAFDPSTGEFDYENTTPIRVAITATGASSGASVRATYRDGLYWDAHLVVDGDQVDMTGFPLPVRDSFGETMDMIGTLVDDDNDGVADRIEGSLTLSAPGIAVGNIRFEIGPPVVGCVEGSTGAVPVTVQQTDDGVDISWSGDDDGLALYVTDFGVTLPMGPNQPITGGKTYWAIAAESLASGFTSPVRYGTVPASATDDGTTHDAVFESLQDDKCYSFSVVTTGFAVGTVTVRWNAGDDD